LGGARSSLFTVRWELAEEMGSARRQFERCVALTVGCAMQGNYDPLLAGSRRKESADEAAARLREEEAEARAAVG